MDIVDSRLQVILHQDFLHYEDLEAVFRTHEVCIWCLGTSQTQVSSEEYLKVTYTYTLAAAAAMLKSNPEMRFIFLSAMGADPSERSRTLFRRIKGRTERALQQLPFKELYLIRPGGIRAMSKKKNAAWYERVLSPVYFIFEWMTPRYVINSIELARVMIRIAKYGAPDQILNNPALRRLGKEEVSRPPVRQAPTHTAAGR